MLSAILIIVTNIFKMDGKDIKTISGMTPEKFRQLEILMSELCVHLKHRCCVIPNYLDDGFHVGIYSRNGDIKGGSTAPTLEQACDKLLSDE
jgi:hypothetical protein